MMHGQKNIKLLEVLSGENIFENPSFKC